MKTITLLAAALVATSASADAQRAPQLTRRINFHNPEWSPNARAILFEANLDGWSAIYTVRPDGGGLTRLTDPAYSSEQPGWSPDGASIVYSSNESGTSNIWVMRADGSARRRLTSQTSGAYYQSSFSPDGRLIVFQGRPDNREVRDRIFVVGADGSGFRQLTDSTFGAEGPRWSSDGATITFRQVPYPRRLWAEMTARDVEVAKSGERRMSIRPDGTDLAPTSASDREDTGDPAIPDDAVRSRDGSAYAFTKVVEGYSGLYVYDAHGKRERLVAGGPGAGPVGYLRTMVPVVVTDTIDTYESPRSGGEIRRGNGVWMTHSLRRVGGRRWETLDEWHDSTGAVTARQMTRTTEGAVTTEVESVRASGDSATLLVIGSRATGWVVPQGQVARLIDGMLPEERYASAFVIAAIVQARPRAGEVFVAPSYSLYGTNPLDARVDSITVVRRDTLHHGPRPIPVVVLARSSGVMTWVDEATGSTVAARGNAGPARHWWHVRRGVVLAGLR